MYIVLETLLISDTHQILKSDNSAVQWYKNMLPSNPWSHSEKSEDEKTTVNYHINY